MHSIKTRIIALVLASILVTALAIGGASILNSMLVVNADSTQMLNLLCANRAEAFNSLLRQIEQSTETLMVYASHQLESIEQLSSNPDYVESFTAELTDVAINAALATDGATAVYVRFNPELTGSTAGLFYSRTSLQENFRKQSPTDILAYNTDDIAHVGWYYLPVKNGMGTWIAPYFNQNIDIEMVSYVIPFYADDTLVGVVGMDIEFNMLRKIVAETSVYDTGYAFLTNEKSEIVYHQSLPRGTLLTEYNNAEFRDMAVILQGVPNEDTLVSYSYEQEAKKSTFRILDNNMRLVLTVPKKEIDKQQNWLVIQILFACLIVVALAVIVTIFFARRLAKPLLELTEAAQKIAKGDLGITIKHQSQDEVGILAESFRQTVEHLHKYISYINELAYRDSLTGVKNKTAYLEYVSRMEDTMRLQRPSFAVVVFDVNNLKKVNDTSGHDFGDMLIMDISKMICRVFKHSPVFRIGGDEFVTILQNTDYENYLHLLAQLDEELQRANSKCPNDLPLSFARGIAIYGEDTDLTFNDVFKRADSAMYRNKTEMKQERE